MSRFRRDTNGDIVGPGTIRFPPELQSPPGIVRLDIDLLNRIYELGVLEGRTSNEANAEARRGDYARGMMESVAEDLGIDPDTMK